MIAYAWLIPRNICTQIALIEAEILVLFGFSRIYDHLRRPLSRININYHSWAYEFLDFWETCI